MAHKKNTTNLTVQQDQAGRLFGHSAGGLFQKLAREG